MTFVPEYVALGQAMHVNGGGAAALESLATRELVGGWPSHYGPHGPWASRDEVTDAADRARAAYVVRFRPGGAALVSWPPAGAPLAPHRTGTGPGAGISSLWFTLRSTMTEP